MSASSRLQLPETLYDTWGQRLGSIEPELQEFMERNVEMGLNFAHLSLDVRPVIPHVIFETAPGKFENRLLHFGIADGVSPDKDQPMRDVKVEAELESQVFGMAGRLAVGPDTFVAASLELGWLWEHSALKGRQVLMQNRGTTYVKNVRKTVDQLTPLLPIRR